MDKLPHLNEIIIKAVNENLGKFHAQCGYCLLQKNDLKITSTARTGNEIEFHFICKTCAKKATPRRLDRPCLSDHYCGDHTCSKRDSEYLFRGL